VRRRQGIVLNTLALLLSGCSGAESTGQTDIDPAGSYKQLKEKSVEKSRCGSDGFGCGTIATSGNLVQGAFTFEELFVTCHSSARGYLVDLRNSRGSAPTFRLQVLLHGLSEPDIYYKCEGGVLVEGGGYEAGSCDLFLQVHSSVLAASVSRPCEVTFDPGSSPLQGTVSCPQLEQSSGHLTIAAEESCFICQPPQ
jgi:hypothetical protein